MDFLGIGSTELIVVLLLAGIVLGPERLARTARELGRFVRNVKNYFSTLSSELNSELDLLDDLKEVQNELKKEL